MIYFLCLLFAFLLAAGQFLFKLTALNMDGGKFSIESLFSWYFFSSLILYGLTTILWIFILTKIPISVAYPFSLLGAAFVFAFSYFIFKEPISFWQLFGVFMMLIGLLVATVNS